MMQEPMPVKIFCPNRFNEYDGCMDELCENCAKNSEKSMYWK